MATKKMIRNGVSEEGMRALFKQGYSAEVICVEDAQVNSIRSTYRGCWNIRAVSPDGQTERVLITQRNACEPKKIKTTTGLITLLLDLGCDSAHLPLKEGGRRTNTFPHRNAPAE